MISLVLNFLQESDTKPLLFMQGYYCPSFEASLTIQLCSVHMSYKKINGTGTIILQLIDRVSFLSFPCRLEKPR